ncbi:MAG: MoxR family ATPase [Ghiorsea sp.]|nr:MoxR family ATPase [Ghiorsea sp.]MDQ6980926.1 MoxR family ATPase [Ghiorsea sp.]MDQ7057451.1 MoxR family ATPase [Ghiorsea sp.]
MNTFEAFKTLKNSIEQRIIGQSHLANRLLIAMLADGHLLVEGAPGLAKTRAINVLSEHIEGDFHRVQFTPDLLPSDLTGVEVYRPQDGSFHFQKGPLFHHLVLADEINRAPAKVQAALLEAMAERQITVGSVSYPLPDLFMVMATQNPIEQEGTYPLPEAQLDRFLLHVRIDYPDAKSEQEILRLSRAEASHTESKAETLVTQNLLFKARQEVLDLHVAETLETYMVQLIMATRANHTQEGVVKHLQYGASPRATIALDRCARAHAWLDGRDFVTPEDIQSIAFDVLRHRLLLNYEAEASGLTTDDVIHQLIAQVAVP